MIKNTNYKLYLMLCLVAAILIVAFYYNIHTPLIADDFTYSVRNYFEKKNSISFADFNTIISYQVNHYFTWGGRSVVHTLAQFSLLFGKNIFNYTNTLMYILFTLLIYFHINGYKKLNPMLYLLINVLLVLINPAFGQTNLWLIGASNYLWGTTIILAFLLPFRLHLERPHSNRNTGIIPFIIVFGLLAGWCNENTSGAAIFLVLAIISYIKFIKKDSIPKWMFLGLIFSVLGFSLMILAPGNAVRSAYFDTPMLDRIIRTFEILQLYFIPYIFATICLGLLQFKTNRENKQMLLLTSMYFLAFLAANFAMVLAPVYPERATFGVFTFLIIAMGIAYTNTNSLDTIFALNIFSIPLIFTMMSFLLIGAKDTKSLYSQANIRENQIISDRSMGITDIETFMLYPQTRFNPMFGIFDIQEDPSFWINLEYEIYYDINSIRVVK